MMIASSVGLNCPDQTLQGLVSHRPSQDLKSQDPLLVSMEKVSAFEVVALPPGARAANAELPAVVPAGPPAWLPHTQTKSLPSFHTWFLLGLAPLNFHNFGLFQMCEYKMCLWEGLIDKTGLNYGWPTLTRSGSLIRWSITNVFDASCSSDW